MFFLRRMRKRNNTFHYRRRVPSDLIEIFNLKEFTKTLKTNNKEQANLLISHYNSCLDEIFFLLRRGLYDPMTAREKIDALLLSKKFTENKKISYEPYECASRKTLTEIIEEYKRENLVKWSPRTKSEYDGIFSRIAEYFYQKPASKITRPDIVAYREVLYADLEVTTVNKYLSQLSSIFTYACDQDYVRKNYAARLQLQDERDGREQRKKYDDDDIITLVKLLSKNRAQWENENKPSRFWVPIIALFSGMRVNEICQLYIEDIKWTKHKLYYFDINKSKDKRLKTKSSKRLVPIHPVIERLGFLKFVSAKNEDRCKGMSERLFPELTNGPNGYSTYFVKWFSGWNRKHLTEDEEKCFHSLRANVATALHNSSAKKDFISVLLGHKVNNISIDVYAKETDLIILYDLITDLGFQYLVDFDYAYDYTEFEKIREKR